MGYTIKRIYRIQNRYLWRYYEYEKQRLAELRQTLGGPGATHDVETKKLWHGTSTTDPKSIYMGEEGFDPRFSRPGD